MNYNNPMIPNDEVLVAFDNAIKSNNIFLINQLAKKFDKRNLTLCLFKAIYLGKHDVCKILILRGAANVSLKAKKIENPLVDPSNSVAPSTPLIDLLRRKYFDLADVFLKRKHFVD